MTRLDYYREKRGDLIKQITLCHSNKERIRDFLRKLNYQYNSKIIDASTYWYNLNEFFGGKNAQDWYDEYDDHIEKCHEGIKFCEEKINKLQDRSPYPRMFMLVGIISLALSVFFFFQPTITGLVSYNPKILETFEDGYVKEGSQWVQIQGSRLYERCLQVNSGIDFNSVEITAKITSATDNENLKFNLYMNDGVNNEPLKLVDSCEVTEYDNLWKSCSIKNLNQNKGEYWICASNIMGDPESTYYTIAFQKGDLRRTALWTGENWQKLDGASYTIKADFMKYNEKS